ncbi:non-ribosomal peptide synthase/amino acid adenylation enzyme [Cylindrospermum stagnale PCC 7417]|uniref:Non-ribosomal peptide synthase/amino acid adenylation enzyme n=1 Tax=Cylindrospermum stagnale PCC 7417 TaxID=56107 RepID=K9WTU7_9NOST|nr:non-ribosomal peptide synthetase [Cylindrospermum stagnale]AFZ23810.1 non-ribosomal peptide synthase/amino acid adenylation enzyme [Cylindrospermum stagnale PCC 7417]
MQTLSIEGFQISPQQKRLWLLQSETNHQPYRVQGAVVIEGNIQDVILEKAIHNILAKYEILRTNFPTLAGMIVPLQVIQDESAIKLNYHDWHKSENQQIKIENFFQVHNKIYFDLDKGFNGQIDIIKISANKYILLLAISAICADRVSLHHLLRDISETYHAYSQELELEDTPLQYADIAAWQNELLLGEEAETARDYWQKQKISNLQLGKLPNEKQVGEQRIFQPQSVGIKFDSDTDAIAKIKNVDISKFLMACWQILLWRLTNKTATVLALCSDGRNYEELQPTVGLLAKYLPINIELQDDYIFSDILKQLEQQVTQINQWQDYFNLEECFAEAKNSQKVPFLPFAFEFISQPSKYFAGEVSFSIEKIYSCIERFQVKLFCWHQGDSLAAELYYDANLFNQEDIERLAAQFQTLLTSVINHPETAIAQLEILSFKQRQQLLVEFNNTKTTPAPYQCIHHWIEAQADKTPDNIAIVFEDKQLTYQELNTKANQLAHYLVSQGIKPETVVALCLERSLDVIIGILGILKTGAAYLPLEPSLPEEALAFRLQDAQASVLLTQTYLVDKIKQFSLVAEKQVKVVCLDTDVSDQLTQDNILSFATSENLAYIIYTSGSTGKPKGVAVEHRQLLNYVNGILEKLDLPVAASFATVSTFAADLGKTAIFSALCTGGCLHIISEECAKDPVAFADYNQRYSLDCLKIVPSHLSALLTGSNPEQILPRQRLILGGEAASWELIKRVSELAPKCKIFNHYGPTETTVGVLTYPVEQASTDSLSNTVPLGRPLANTEIYLLDNYYQPVPLGVSGEIYIGGDSVARGYLNQPELTAERFIHHCLSPRLYKTGDLARYLPDGNLEFLGRIDDQVKLHGFRIELGEIEAILCQHPQVREVVVVAREDRPGKKLLVAYIVPEEQIANFKSFELRDFLKQKLPDYMVPSQFILLKALPLTANGKIERKSLPAPDAVKPELQATFVAPRTPAEVALAKIWVELLGLEQVSIHDNFFELGGDSIIGIQAIAKANQVGLRLTPKQIFECQTIAKLSIVAEITSKVESEQGLVIGSVPLTPIQHNFFGQNLPAIHHWNQSFLLELQQKIEPILLQQAIHSLLAHHDALRLRFKPKVDAWESFNAGVDQELPFTKFDFSDIVQEQRQAAIEAKAAELQASLDLSSNRLVQVALFDLGTDQNSRLLIIIHHLAVDGVSWRILLSDLQTALEQLQRNEEINLPAKTTSFKQWAECLQDYAHKKKLDSQLDYWCSKSRKQVYSLPVDYLGGLNTLSTSKTLSVLLNEAETTALLQKVPAVYHTQINDVLLTALAKSFAEWTGEQNLLVNLEGHGREDIFSDVDLSRTVGWFTTVFPVLLNLEESSNVGDALKAIKEQLRSIPNRGFDYGVLRYLCSDSAITNSLAAMPQAEVCFNYLGQFDQVLQESSLFTIAPESSGETRSPLGNRRHLLEINGFVTGGCLQLDWIYSAAIYKQLTVSTLAQKFVQALREIISHCQSTNAGGYTPSDFSKANLSQKELDNFLAQINRRSEKKGQ